jgi:hypothetical protein
MRREQTVTYHLLESLTSAQRNPSQPNARSYPHMPFPSPLARKVLQAQHSRQRALNGVQVGLDCVALAGERASGVPRQNERKKKREKRQALFQEHHHQRHVKPRADPCDQSSRQLNSGGDAVSHAPPSGMRNRRVRRNSPSNTQQPLPDPHFDTFAISCAGFCLGSWTSS